MKFLKLPKVNEIHKNYYRKMEVSLNVKFKKSKNDIGQGL
jgi:hypothetical protein